jgi:uncharacterized protein (UPF0332 family)
MIEGESIYLIKAIESLQGAESEYANGRYNNCANRCYYACFQAAVHALADAGIAPEGARAIWSHEGLQATFVRELINRRKNYPADLRDVLARTYTLRQTADYTQQWVTDVQASRALRRTRSFLVALQAVGGETT